MMKMKITNGYEDLEYVKSKISSQLLFRDSILFLY